MTMVRFHDIFTFPSAFLVCLLALVLGFEFRLFSELTFAEGRIGHLMDTSLCVQEAEFTRQIVCVSSWSIT